MVALSESKRNGKKRNGKKRQAITLTSEDGLAIEELNSGIDTVNPKIVAGSYQKLLETLENNNPLNRCVRDEKGKIVAYLACDDGVGYLPEHLKRVYKGKKVANLKYTAAKPGSIKNFVNELKKLKKRAKKKGYDMIYCHGRYDRLNPILERYGFEDIGVDQKVGTNLYILDITELEESGVGAEQLTEDIQGKISGRIDDGHTERVGLHDRYQKNISSIQSGISHYLMMTQHPTTDPTTIADALRDLWRTKQQQASKDILHGQEKTGRLHIKKVLDRHQQLNEKAQKELQAKIRRESPEPPTVTVAGKQADLYRLETKTHLEQETAQLGHCIGEKGSVDVHLNKIENNKMIVYSIREKQGNALATVELSPNKEYGGYSLAQVKGTGNEEFTAGDKNIHKIIEGITLLANQHNISKLGPDVSGYRLLLLENDTIRANLITINIIATTQARDFSGYPNLKRIHAGGAKGKIENLSRRLEEIDISETRQARDFSGCPNLKRINAGSAKGKIENPPGLEEIDISGTTQARDFSGCPNLKRIGARFAEGEIENPPGLEEINIIATRQDRDFSGYPNLKKILAGRAKGNIENLPRRLEEIDIGHTTQARDFSGCYNLKKIDARFAEGEIENLPPGLEEIDISETKQARDFSGCPNLKRIHAGGAKGKIENLPRELEEIYIGQTRQDRDFSGCPNLKKIHTWGAKGEILNAPAGVEVLRY